MKQRMAWISALALVAVACSADDDEGTGTGFIGGQPTPANAGINAGNNAGNNAGGNIAGGNNSVGPAPNPGGNGNGGDNSANNGNAPLVERSFIWIANSAEGTVSKIDTETLEELGRYQTSPNGTGSPSRTSVASDGSVAVAHRGKVGDAQGETGITKILSTMCPDANGDGVVQTSTGRGDVLPWGTDECVVWHTPLDFISNRPVAWAPNPAPDFPPVIWTAGATMCTSADCSFDAVRLDGQTGQVTDVVTVSGLTGTDFIASSPTAAGANPIMIPGFMLPIPGVTVPEHYGPYGGASDGGGNFWIFNSNTTDLIRIDNASLTYQAWPVPMGNGYGITIDSKGRVFLCGDHGVSRFDPGSQTWMMDGGAVDVGFNGCMADGMGTVWVGGGADYGTAGLHAYNADTVTHFASHNVGAVKGVSIDYQGNVWGVSATGTMGQNPDNIAWRLNPTTGQVDSYNGLNGAYTYSDMTGVGLAIAGVVIPI